MIPLDVETHIKELLEAEPNLPLHIKPGEFLTPVTNPDYGKDDPSQTLPPLQDTDSEEGNRLYWNISNSSMWAGHNATLDEMFEVLWSLFGFFRSTDDFGFGGHCG